MVSLNESKPKTNKPQVDKGRELMQKCLQPYATLCKNG